MGGQSVSRLGSVHTLLGNDNEPRRPLRAMQLAEEWQILSRSRPKGNSLILFLKWILNNFSLRFIEIQRGWAACRYATWNSRCSWKVFAYDIHEARGQSLALAVGRQAGFQTPPEAQYFERPKLPRMFPIPTSAGEEWETRQSPGLHKHLRCPNSKNASWIIRKVEFKVWHTVPRGLPQLCNTRSFIWKEGVQCFSWTNSIAIFAASSVS